MMGKPQIEAAKRWGKIFLEDLDTFKGITPGARKNLNVIQYPHWIKAQKEFLRIIDVARWGEGLTLWHLKRASLASEVAKFWEGKSCHLEELLPCSSQASEFESFKNRYPKLRLGRLIGGIARDFPERVTEHRTNKERTWRIYPLQCDVL